MLFQRHLPLDYTDEFSSSKATGKYYRSAKVAELLKPTPRAESQPLQFTPADLLVFFCICIWAINVPLVKLLMDSLAPLEITMARYTIGVIFFIALTLLREKTLRVQWRHLPLFILAALLGITLNQICFVYAINNTTSSEVSLLMASTPTFTTLLAALIGQERIRSNYWISLPLAIAGVVLIVLTAPSSHLGGNLLGDSLALATAASWAAYTVAIRPLLSHYSIACISSYVLAIGLFALLPFGLPQLKMEHFTSLAPNLWLTLGYCTFGALVLTNFLWYGGVKHLGAPRTAFYSYLQPFGGVLAACYILGEVLIPWQILGGLLVIVSMILYRSNIPKLLRNFSKGQKP
ncbi:MAG: DMT family transporter [Chloroflexota bacterium]|nr:DMT family transporter [Chloroflexota bacterium]